MKATSIFGGVQVFNIIISIGRSKILAILLGPAGIGILGLIMSTTKLISSLTNFGLGISAVKEIAVAFELGDEKQLSKTIVIVKRWIWYTGIFGAILTIILSPFLSELTFGNKDYTIAFVWLSITLLLNQLTSGSFVFLQGLRKLKYLAKANVIGAASGLLVSVPIYYYMGVDGIVPAMIFTAILGFLVAFYFTKKVKTTPVPVSFKETKTKGKSMLIMGFMLSISGIMVLGVSYVIRIFINNNGGVEDVGLYNAGIAIISTYVGLLFTAMETDYFPRLSAVVHDNEKAVDLINQQAEIAILILAPVLIVFLVFVDWIITILYSSEFIPIKEMIYWAAIGMFFKVAAWVVAFFFIAKGASKLFFWNELVTNIYTLILNLVGYYYWGLAGLGISYLLSYFVYLIQIYTITKNKYNFNFTPSVVKIFLLQFLLAIVCLLTTKLFSPVWSYSIGSVVILISMYYSFIELDARLNLKDLMAKYLKK
ncbi:O-antigen translocase [Maribacter hydrothermalis]|uniref:O-antigen translocase n=2 Tax=Maribacter hydrothermalis TaxID=1836467 RepID=A0A1B7ZCJ4_9FLAO|nr:O-antigen translocase [Maribacter hydrothermalis]OBR40592.1 O-antigen translocase [Maribacter hydrothermalis]